MSNYTLNINGFNIDAYYNDEDIKNVFVPLLKSWTDLQKEKDKRIFVYLVAPPGTGKSTLATFLEKLSKEYADITDIQSVGIDGFHYNQEYLASHFSTKDASILLKSIKGSPETFDVKKLENKIIESLEKDIAYWPTYSRILHDVIDNDIQLNSSIILLEGNYLLLNNNPWNKLKKYADQTIFINSDPSELKNKLIERKIDGGLTQKEATEFFKITDEPDIYIVLHESTKPNIYLNYKNGRFTFA
jgi:putative kinase